MLVYSPHGTLLFSFSDLNYLLGLAVFGTLLSALVVLPTVGVVADPPETLFSLLMWQLAWKKKMKAG